MSTVLMTGVDDGVDDGVNGVSGDKNHDATGTCEPFPDDASNSKSLER